MNNLQVQPIGQNLKIPIFHLFHDLGKTGKSRLKQYSKLTMFNFFVNWEKLEVQLNTNFSQRLTIKNPNLNPWTNLEKLCPNLCLAVENEMGNLHKIRLITFHIFMFDLM